MRDNDQKRRVLLENLITYNTCFPLKNTSICVYKLVNIKKIIT